MNSYNEYIYTQGLLLPWLLQTQLLHPSQAGNLTPHSNKLLARAYGIPVGRRSGGRLATTLVATKINIIFSFPFLFFFWRERVAFQRSTAGNDVVATIFIRLFFFIFPLFFPFFPPSQPFLIEGVLGSKNLFSESCLERPKI